MYVPDTHRKVSIVDSGKVFCTYFVVLWGIWVCWLSIVPSILPLLFLYHNATLKIRDNYATPRRFESCSSALNNDSLRTLANFSRSNDDRWKSMIRARFLSVFHKMLSYRRSWCDTPRVCISLIDREISLLTVCLIVILLVLSPPLHHAGSML